MAIFETSCTLANVGKKFWRCPNYKSINDEYAGCNFFKWFLDKVIDERDVLIMRQRRKITNLETSLKFTKKALKYAVCNAFQKGRPWVDSSKRVVQRWELQIGCPITSYASKQRGCIKWWLPKMDSSIIGIQWPEMRPKTDVSIARCV
ncbi:hypothetical protein CR513_18612, partial [Mucuna pruriens]